MAKVSKKSKNTQREALLSLIYQQELFDHLDAEDTGESKEFREFITEEAKERGVDSLELIDYFAENREELTELLKKKNYDKYIHPGNKAEYNICLLYTSPSPRDGLLSRMPSSA